MPPGPPTGPPPGWPGVPQAVGVPPPDARPRGRGFTIAGIVLVAVSVAVGVGGSLFAFSRYDVAQFERDVVVEGPASALVPGELRFRITEPLDDSRRADMTVGVGISASSTAPVECSLTEVDGGPVGLLLAPAGTALLRPTPDAFDVVQQAELGPGEYVLTCGLEGEPSSGRGANFTVGRVLGTDDALGLVGPTLLFIASAALGVVTFVIGVVLLVVGLVRSRRPTPGVPPPSGHWMAPPSP